MPIRKDLRPPVPIVSKAGRPPSQDRKRPVEQRECARHGRVEFAHYAAGQGTFRWRCKRCVGEAVTRRHQKVKRLLVEEAGGCCVLCGYDRTPFSLHFHHVNPSSKSFRIAVSSGKALDTYREEIEKCVLVCANCHGEIEAGLMVSPPAGAHFGDAPYLPYDWREED